MRPDLTSLVDTAARAVREDFDTLPPVAQLAVRNTVLPVVTALMPEIARAERRGAAAMKAEVNVQLDHATRGMRIGIPTVSVAVVRAAMSGLVADRG